MTLEREREPELSSQTWSGPREQQKREQQEGDQSGEPTVVAALSADPLDVTSLVDSVRRDDCGGVVVFEGTVRSPNHGHRVLALEYEAWQEKTPQQLWRIASDVVAEHDLRAALVVHRTGRVDVGDAAVVVVAVTIHRAAAFRAAEALIDRVKSEAWIWKKELRVGGEVWIEGCG